MNALKPITTEYIRRFSILMLLTLFTWMFFYSPSDIYEIQVKNYVEEYQEKVGSGSLDPSKTSLDEYIAYKMKGPYPWSKRKQKIVEVKGKFGAVEVLLKPAYPGTGVIAGATIRAICECVGIKDILTKILKKSTNPINVTRAVFDAFSKLKG